MDPNIPPEPRTRSAVPRTRAGDFVHSRKPDISGWLTVTFEHFGKEWLTYSLQGLVVLLPLMVLTIVPYIGVVATMTQLDPQGQPPTEFLIWMGAVYGGLFLGLLVMFVLMPGLYHTAGKHLRGEAITFGDLFGASDRILPCLGAGVLTSILTLIVALPTCGFGVLFLMPVFTHVLAAVVIGREGPMQAIGSSFAIVKSHYWWYFLWSLLIGLLQQAGQAACLIGMGPTLAIAVIAQVVAYRRVAGFADPSDDEIDGVFGG